MMVSMATVTVSSKFQVVIPEEVRSRLKLQPGQKVVVVEKDGVVHLIPLKPIKDTRGFASGTRTSSIRDEQDRF
jgi:AbrB family looped-hinge helix DNA binding protein